MYSKLILVSTPIGETRFSKQWLGPIPLKDLAKINRIPNQIFLDWVSCLPGVLPYVQQNTVH